MPKLINFKTGEEFQLRKDRRYTLIGRSSEADIRIFDSKNFVSRFHATIFRHDEGYYLIDHSLNLTYYPVFDGVASVSERSVLETAFRSSSQKQNGDRTIPGHAEKVTVINNYNPHRFAGIDDMKDLIITIENDLLRPMLIKRRDIKECEANGVARKLEHGALLSITNLPEFRFMYAER